MRGPIARATLRTSAVLGIRLLVQAGTLLIVARLLGPHDYGAFAGLAALAVLMGTLSSFGTPLVLLREVSREPNRRAAVLPFAISTTLLCGSLLLGLYLVITLALFRSTTIAPGVMVALGITELLVQPLLSLPGAEHQGHGRIAASQLLITLPLALRMFAALTVWMTSPNDPLEAYAWGYLAASALSLLVATRTLHDTWPGLSEWRLPNRHELRDAAGYAVLSVTGAGPAELDKTLAAKLLPLTVAGVYAAGARVIGALTLPVIAMMLSAMPRLFRESDTEPGHARRLLGWVFVSTLAYSLLLGAALWLAAPLFDVLFGVRYSGLGRVLQWLTLAVPGMSLRIAAGSALVTIGKPWIRVSFEITGIAVLSIAAVLLAAHGAGEAIPIALACSEWSMAALGWVAVTALARRRNVV